eukprot:CAMPEP_0197174160 /NCGR_PEP_ID=MMETSP1423-20130617/802_1 /TAXON_ID=476441 /ORGANISM="Pseudo-nitzschia heimii, Strain UNC1101" /LENGTH=297 /DNA_ID=CAMNT_0042623059 /DNA_START=65 /DNA_END=958 /DNA_ORIENTATION=+
MAIPVNPEEVPRSLICAICLELPEEPTILKSCSHVFCKGCIERSITDNNNHYDHDTCPICRSNIQEGDVLPLRSNPFAYRQWSEIPVRCEHPRKKGCHWIGSMGDYRSHKCACAQHTPSSRERHEHTRFEKDNIQLLEKQPSSIDRGGLELMKSRNKELEHRLMSSNEEKEELKQRIERMGSVIKTKNELEEGVRLMKMRHQMEQIKMKMDLEAKVQALERELLITQEENRFLLMRVDTERANAKSAKMELEGRVLQLEKGLHTISRQRYEHQMKIDANRRYGSVGGGRRRPTEFVN